MEWLPTYQYSLKMRKSHDHEDLLLRIVEHLFWVALNKDRKSLY
jgi:hypothetical protein